MRIALIHALTESIAPIHKAFQRHWPEAKPFDLLDNALSADLAEAGAMTPAIRNRFLTLGDYAASQEGAGGKTAAILFTCSAFGPAIDDVKTAQRIPVLKPNEAAFEQAMTMGRHIGLLVTFEPSLRSLEKELVEMAESRKIEIVVTPRLVEHALDALKADDHETHDHLIAKAARDLPHQDVILFGQFSMAQAATAAQQVCVTPLVTTPDAAVLALRKSLDR